MKRILLILGTRPEAIKLAPLILKLRAMENIETTVMVTGQHQEMLKGTLSVFGIVPDIDLNLFAKNRSLLAWNGILLSEIGKTVEGYRPDIVVVHGDTATAFCAANAAFFLGVPVAHVEAGLRSGNIHAPFPEEYNRTAISLISTLDFAPNERAKQTLIEMGKEEGRIFVTGNTVIDALKMTKNMQIRIPMLECMEGKKLVFLSTHRRESLGASQEAVFRAAVRIAEASEDIRIVCPLHRNPEVRRAAEAVFGARRHPHVFLCDPFDVVTCHRILEKSALILTDSGGIQEEASALGKPLLILRSETERQELVEVGAARLVGCDEEKIKTESLRILTDSDYRSTFRKATELYGDGNASERIADKIAGFLSNSCTFT